MTWLGHATVLIETGSVRLLTDPVLRDRILHLRRRVPTPVTPEHLDAILISHLHYDHLDKPSVKGLAHLAIAPAGTDHHLPGYEVRELRAGERTTVRDTVIEAVPAWHDGRRRPGTPEYDTLGYLIDGIWFAGDTDLDPAMEELRGRVEVALIPIWGWGPSLGPGHMDPVQAARAVELIRPEVAIPIHWGTFLPVGLMRRHAGVLTEPPLAFAAALAGSATRVDTVMPGASVDL